MNTKLLRLKILDLAFRGKLVPQDFEEESASELLEKIWTEKERLIRIGEVRCEKKDSTIFCDDDDLHYERFRDGTLICIEDELPYDLPDGWVWSRVNGVCIVNPRNDVDDSTVVSFVPMAQIDDEFSNHFTFQDRPWREIKSGFTHFQDGDIGLAKITPCLENRKSVVFTGLANGIGAGTTELHIFRPIISSLILPEYLLWYFKTERFIKDCIGAFSGAVGQQRVGKDYVASYLLPIPPASEQGRIVHAIENAFKQISSVECDKSYLESAITAVKSKILSLAIQGKLVPQDPNDEPALALLDRIRIARIATGNGKRINTIVHTLNDVAGDYNFDLPQGWAMSALGDISTIIQYGLSNAAEESGNYKFLRITDIQNNRVAWNTVPYTTISDAEAKNFLLEDDDIVFARTGATVGKSYIISGLAEPAVFASYLIRVKTIGVYSLYVKRFFECGFYWEQITDKTVGTGQPNVNGTKLKQLILPIPPLPEQHRIVEAIDVAFKQLDSIAENLG